MSQEALSIELHNKFSDLTNKHTKLIGKKAALENAIMECEKQIDDCYAAARLFGVDLSSVVERADAAIAIAQLPNDQSKATIRNFVIDVLKNAAPGHIKAKQIQDMYEITYGTKLHYKTVGMTLYRLFKDGLVARQGWNWFLLPPELQQKSFVEAHDVIS